MWDFSGLAVIAGPFTIALAWRSQPPKHGVVVRRSSGAPFASDVGIRCRKWFIGLSESAFRICSDFFFAYNPSVGDVSGSFRFFFLNRWVDEF